jgi:DNA replicative helicase MCM subunit Mcm2 (Cdc46/Mcm family)
MEDKNDIVYSLNIEDIQTVAIQEIDRELTEDEIEKVKDLIGEKINWYDAILNSIIEIIGLRDVQ